MDDENQVPIGCRARATWIACRAEELATTFVNGNRSDTFNGLQELPPSVAYAVLAEVMHYHLNFEQRQDLSNYLREVA